MSSLFWRCALKQRGIALALSTLLLTASLLKAWSEIRYPQSLAATWFDRPVIFESVVVFEAMFGVVLIAGSWPRLAWYVAICVFSVFLAITALETARGNASCKCFGVMHVRPIHTMLLDVAIIAALMLSGRPSKNHVKTGGGRNWTIACLVGVCWFTAVIVFFRTRPTVAMALGEDFGRPGTLVVFEPKNWAGKQFTLAEHIDIGSHLGSGRWIVLLVHHDCDHCAAAVPRYVSASTAEGSGTRLAVIEMPPFDDGTSPPPWQLPKSVLSGRLDQTRDWFATTPVAILIEDGKVLTATEGDSASIPNPTWWKR